jgi:hypothetical protein
MENLAKEILSGVLAMMQKPTLKQMTIMKNVFLVLLLEQGCYTLCSMPISTTLVFTLSAYPPSAAKLSTHLKYSA